MRIASWNVNGVRAAENKGLAAFLEGGGWDVVGLQEVRAHPDQVPERLRRPAGRFCHYVAAERKGYSGVGLASSREPDDLSTTLGEPRFDVEGRLQVVRLGALTLANVYFPNGSGKEGDNSRVPFKLEFYRCLWEALEPLKRAGGRVLVMGDFNTAHRPIDLARPRDNEGTSGFLPVEREEFDRWIRSGWVDTFRVWEAGGGHYTWWSQRFGVRARNIGWRIDYVLASPGAMPFVRGAAIHPDIQGSDHCPISVDVDPEILE